jgi:flagellar FliJ protein
MDKLTTLIRIHRERLDELRRERVQLEDQIEKFEFALTSLDEELRLEQALLREDPLLGPYFRPFAESNRERYRIITQALKTIRDQLTALEEKLYEQFSELKRYEIAKQLADERKREALARAETQLYDEMGIEGFFRNE